MLNDVVIGRTTKARDKACSAGVVIRVAPIGVSAHGRLSNAEGLLVQRRICIRSIEFCALELPAFLPAVNQRVQGHE
jgi:hypothetical protein